MPGDLGETYGADLDTPRVVHNLYGADLEQYGVELHIASDLKSAGPVTLPDPEACSYAARNQAIGEVKLIQGKTAWCFITRKGSLVWLHLLSGGDFGYNTLKFELMRWEKTS